MNTFVDKVKANPMISFFAAFVLTVSTVSGTLTATGQLDSWVMTHAEHDEDFRPLEDKVKANEAWNRCARYEQRIADLEDRKWKRQQANASLEAIRDIDKDIRNARRQYDALNCDKVLSE